MTPIGFKYVWLIWSSAFMLAWLMLYTLAPGVRHLMLRASLPTAAFCLYWSCVYKYVGWRHGRSAAFGGLRSTGTP